jgi:hypothetical protein
MTTTMPHKGTAFRIRLQNPYVTTLGERVHLPGEPGYDEVRTGYKLAADLRPAAVARPHSVREVGAVVRAAVACGLKVAPQSTGHAALALSQHDLSDTVLVKLDELTGVTIDPEERVARVVGGTVWQEVLDAAAPHGLTALHGSAGDVAVAGFILSGGLSFYGRRHGVAANSVRAVEFIDASGELRRVTPYREPELFWAVRGAGGNLGVVVAVEIALVPYADVYAGMLLWPQEAAADVVPAWRDWTATAPDEVSTSLRLFSFPPLPELPPFLSGRRVLIIDGAVSGVDDAAAAQVLAPLRALAPEMDTFARIPAAALTQVHMDPPMPVPSVGDHRVLGGLPDKAVEALLEQVRQDRALMFTELRQLGGAVGRPVEGGGSVSHFEGDFLLFALALAPGAEAAAAGFAAARGLCATMQPWAVERAVPTFAEETAAPTAMWRESVRLRYAIESVDPTGVFVANHRAR